MAIAASAVLGLFVGYQGGQVGSQGAVESGLASEFLLLLREPAGGLPAAALPSQTELVREYREWALVLEEEGRLAGAERLEAPSGFWVTGAEGRRVAPELADAPLIGGYFIVRASDADAVLETARQSPHLRYGGTIEVREIAAN